MSGEKARESGLPILGRIVSYAVTGVDPSVMGIGPVSACRTALARAGWTLDDVDLIEANEAFAAQALAVGKQLGWDERRGNVNGGGLSPGSISYRPGSSDWRLRLPHPRDAAVRNAAP